VDLVSFGSNTVSYLYLTNSSLVSALWFNNGLSNVLVTSKQYDGFYQLTNVFSTVGGQLVAGHAYGYNIVGQRTNCVQNDGSVWNYGYDFLGQVTNGVRKWSDGQTVAGQSFAYAFDDIGNRTKDSRDSDVENYVANSLNQYVQKTIPGSVWIEGDATTNAVITVNGVLSSRHGAFYSRDLTVDNSSQAVYTNVSITGIGTNGATVVTNTITGHAFTAKTPEALSYDFDGNLTNDARWIYTWNAENRLIAMETNPALTNQGVSRVKLMFTYDSQARRVRKQVFTWSTNNVNWVLTSDYFFAYDGWNLIHEERRPDSHTRRVNQDYVWGIDLSGSMQGGGGIGGLLAVSSSEATSSVSSVLSVSFACFDANGNVSDYISAATGANVAHYEYSPFGELTAATGANAGDFSFRFSTKYFDFETGLYAYGHRYYEPPTGRWISRDPIGEQGGLNLVTFVVNEPLGHIDANGNSSFPPWPLSTFTLRVISDRKSVV
jgi:RHS repeat-associated protein